MQPRTNNPFRTIVELDGVILNLRPCYWDAYGRAAAEIGAARTAPENFWRLVRTDAPRGQLVPHTTTSQIQRFGELFDAAIEDSDCLAQCEPHEGILEKLGGLGRSIDRVLVSMGTNREARQDLMRTNGIDNYFMEMAALSTDGQRRSAELRALAEGKPTTVMVAASETLVRSASLAGFAVVGCSTGTSIARRLTQAGAAWVISDLQELVDDYKTGGRQLTQLGVAMPSRA